MVTVISTDLFNLRLENFNNSLPLRHDWNKKSLDLRNKFEIIKIIRDNYLIISIVFFIIFSCVSDDNYKKPHSDQEIIVLGIAQDAGFPHINYDVEWEAFQRGELAKMKVVSLGLVDKSAQQKFIFEATPDMPEQLYDLEKHSFSSEKIIDGVFLTHAHIGHYSGLMYFGHEAMGAKDIPVYTMPRMKKFLQNNGPWSQLVDFKNVLLKELKNDSVIELTNNIKVIPFLVPHRDEFSETVGYKIIGKNKSALVIPDINKWELWERSIVEEVKKVDYAFLDATFFKDGEIPRPMSEVPHPFIEETVSLFMNEPDEERNKVIFIHFNHSNPAILPNHKLKDSLVNLGFRFSFEGMRIGL